MKKNTTEVESTPRRNVNLTVSLEPETMEKMELAINRHNEKLPNMAKINRARFVRGCVELGIENPDLLLK